MKNKFILLLLAVLAFGSPLLQLKAQEPAYQEFAPIGAKWWYGWEKEGELSLAYYEVTSTKQVFIEGEPAKYLEVKTYHQDGLVEIDSAFVIQEGAKVFYYDFELERKCLSFDLSLESTENSAYLPQCEDSQDSSSLIRITDLETVLINGQNLIKQKAKVTYNLVFVVEPFEIIEKIGQTNHALHLPIPFNAQLRCYEDVELGFYNTEFMPECEGFQIGIGLSIEDSHVILTEIPFFQVFPNPAKDYVELRLSEEIVGDNLTLRIYSWEGILQQEYQLPKTNRHRINTQNLSGGIYLGVLEADGQNMAQEKLVILK